VAPGKAVLLRKSFLPGSASKSPFEGDRGMTNADASGIAGIVMKSLPQGPGADEAMKPK
jgi:hypothetical protein